MGNNDSKHDVTFDSLVEASESWIDSTGLETFPTTANLIEEVADDEKKKQRVVEHAKGSRVIIHKQLVKLITGFLDLKQKVLCGTLETHIQAGFDKEKELYGEWRGPEQWKQLVRRVIEKRPLVFFTGYDMTTLRNGTTPSSKQWRKVGRDDEEDILIRGRIVWVFRLTVV